MYIKQIIIIISACYMNTKMDVKNLYSRHTEVESLINKLNPFRAIILDFDNIVKITQQDLSNNNYSYYTAGPYSFRCDHNSDIDLEIEIANRKIDYTASMLYASGYFDTCIEKVGYDAILNICICKYIKIVSVVAGKEVIDTYNYMHELDIVNDNNSYIQYYSEKGTTHNDLSLSYIVIEYKCNSKYNTGIEYIKEDRKITLYNKLFCRNNTITEILNYDNFNNSCVSNTIYNFTYTYCHSAKMISKNKKSKLYSSIDNTYTLKNTSAIDIKKDLNDDNITNDVLITTNHYRIGRIPVYLLGYNKGYGMYTREVGTLGVHIQLTNPRGNKANLWYYCPEVYSTSHINIETIVELDDKINVLITYPPLCSSSLFRYDEKNRITASNCIRYYVDPKTIETNLSFDSFDKFTKEDLYKKNILPRKYIYETA